MSEENVFNKKLAPESTMDKVEGLLEHFNLPPKVIAYIRKNQRIIQVTIGVVVVVVVAWSLYGSYVEKMREESANALAVAMEKTGEEKNSALRKVVEDYSSSSSARWAEIELAHGEMQTGNFTAAAEKYRSLLSGIKQENPLYALVVYGIAQAEEAAGNYQQAYEKYDQLKSIKGYESIGYTSLARLEESRNNIDKAIAVYNNFLLAIGEDQSYADAKADIDRKIARLKARK